MHILMTGAAASSAPPWHRGYLSAGSASPASTTWTTTTVSST